MLKIHSESGLTYFSPCCTDGPSVLVVLLLQSYRAQWHCEYDKRTVHCAWVVFFFYSEVFCLLCNSQIEWFFWEHAYMDMFFCTCCSCLQTCGCNVIRLPLCVFAWFRCFSSWGRRTVSWPSSTFTIMPPWSSTGGLGLNTWLGASVSTCQHTNHVSRNAKVALILNCKYTLAQNENTHILILYICP